MVLLWEKRKKNPYKKGIHWTCELCWWFQWDCSFSKAKGCGSPRGWRRGQIRLLFPVSCRALLSCLTARLKFPQHLCGMGTVEVASERFQDGNSAVIEQLLGIWKQLRGVRPLISIECFDSLSPVSWIPISDGLCLGCHKPNCSSWSLCTTSRSN